MDPTMLLATTALQGGLSLISGKGQKDAAAKQGRLQMMEDARVDQLNRNETDRINSIRADLGSRYWETLNSFANGGGIDDVTTSASTVNLDQFLADGERAGFNPVTWLNSGALSLYGVSQSKTTGTGKLAGMYGDALRMMMPDGYMSSPSQIQREISMGEVIGNAGTAALGQFNTGYKLMAASDLQHGLLDKQLAAIAAKGGISTPARGGTAGGALSVGSSTGTAAALSVGAAGKQPVLPGVELDDPKMMNLVPFGWYQDKRLPGAETIEDTYGDALSWIYGAAKFAGDLSVNVGGATVDQGFKNLMSGKTYNGTPTSWTQAPFWQSLVDRAKSDPMYQAEAKRLGLQ